MTLLTQRGARLEHDEPRFPFGENWLTYIANLNERAIGEAERSLCDLLQVNDLEGRTFLDVGAGSGLFSLAARRLGAHVCSFDFDEKSVRCALELKRRFFNGDKHWTIRQGSVLDAQYVHELGSFDVVYSWGVLHHTGDMWRALDHVTHLVGSGGKLCIAIYNDQGFMSDMWRIVKRTYNRTPPALRFIILWAAFIRLWGPTLTRDALRGKPLQTWSSYGKERGMSPWVDLTDWVGGYPFEVATPAEVTAFCAARNLVLTRSVLRSGIGCNEFAFEKAGTRIPHVDG